MKSELESPNGKPRILFVDDEATIRLTLAAILTQEGFDVTVAATVPQALGFITAKTFDVLVSDLNIGQPGDGFTVVSAMRRTQPSAATFILTGYPDFQTALEAIRQQVDDYLIKPQSIKQLVENIKAKIEHPRHIRASPSKRVATLIRENQDQIVQLWLTEARVDKVLQRVDLSDRERTDHMPLVLESLIHMLESGRSEPPVGALEAADKHAVQRKEQGYTVSMIVRESAMLHGVLTRVIQECLLEVELSSVIEDVMKIGETLHAILEESVRTFQSDHVHESA